MPAKPSSAFATLLGFVVWFYCQKIWDISDLCKIDLMIYFLSPSCIYKELKQSSLATYNGTSDLKDFTLRPVYIIILVNFLNSYFLVFFLNID